MKGLSTEDVLKLIPQLQSLIAQKTEMKLMQINMEQIEKMDRGEIANSPIVKGLGVRV